VRSERLQKYMARAGVASRRKCEEMIVAGRVRVNGEVVTALGTKVIPGRDVVEVDGRPVDPPRRLVYYILNKPKGVISSVSDPRGRPTVVDLVNSPHRIYPVGRLDYDSEGLVLLTNDGELTYKLTHPACEVDKVYEVLVSGVPSESKLDILRRGVRLEDGLTAPARVRVLGSVPGGCILEVCIHEGRNRQVRRMMAAVGHEVRALKRVALGPLRLGDLKAGEYRQLSPAEVRRLKGSLRGGKAR